MKRSYQSMSFINFEQNLLTFFVYKIIFIFFVSASIISAPLEGNGALRCESLFLSSNTSSNKISADTFDHLTSNLRGTIEGNLATVFRSEWKAKMNDQKSSELVEKIIRQFLSPQAYTEVVAGLDINTSDFVSRVHDRLYLLKKYDEESSSNSMGISVRDASSPPGTQDSTFTYYSAPLQDGKGKHQIRVRTYLRKVDPKKMDFMTDIQALSSDGKEISIRRSGVDHFNYTVRSAGTHQNFQVSSYELHQALGDLQFYAPHGRDFKLEVKTALKDEIQKRASSRLAGNHMVQKLDLKLTAQQVLFLFKGFSSRDSNEIIKESLSRIQKLRQELLELNPNERGQRRIQAVLSVLTEGVRANPSFLILAGATHYQRNAFESSAGFQVTVDSNQSVHQSIYSANGDLKAPQAVLQTTEKLIPTENNSRHVELKFPINAVLAINGITLYDASTEGSLPPPPPNLTSYHDVIKIFEPYVDSSEHPGKFNYLRNNGVPPCQDRCPPLGTIP